MKEKILTIICGAFLTLSYGQTSREYYEQWCSGAEDGDWTAQEQFNQR